MLHEQHFLFVNSNRIDDYAKDGSKELYRDTLLLNYESLMILLEFDRGMQCMFGKKFLTTIFSAMMSCKPVIISILEKIGTANIGRQIIFLYQMFNI